MKSLLPIIFLAAALGLGYFYLYPEYIKVSDLRAENAEYDDALRMAEEIEKIKAEKIRKLGQIDTVDKLRLQTIIADEAKPLDFSLYIEQLAADNGIELDSITTQTVSGGEAMQAVEATPRARARTVTPLVTTLAFSSSYNDMLGFIRALETNLELSDITSISVATSSDEEGGFSGDYTVTMSFQTYIQS